MNKYKGDTNAESQLKILLTSGLSTNKRSGEDNQFVVVHNGIITNYKEIKQFLTTKGFVFESDTDTEAVAKLIQHIHRSQFFEQKVANRFLQPESGLDVPSACRANNIAAGGDNYLFIISLIIFVLIDMIVNDL